ncbi:hypothetical protein [Pedobacter cryoconitis]|uniref:hypothetical protein n=1 Tax=Pedobacter cryoconitis TaxID=188932 RepID=UPI0016188EEA|nr:hypothetical protein [Pedobacter cryoconitis]MBB5646085.1 putative dehydrogenase [Pedobacter cryoconitis]
MAQLNCSFNTAPHRNLRVIGSKEIISCGYNNHTNADTGFIGLKTGIDWDYKLKKIPVSYGNGLLFEAEHFYSSIKSFNHAYTGTSAEESLDNTNTLIENYQKRKEKRKK